MIGIIDYGIGNINAFANIYKQLNIPFLIAKTPSDLRQATHLILPGVGAFDYAIEKLNLSGMRETLDTLVLEQKKHILGVCVGMQMMAAQSEEGLSPGLNWIPGTVKLFDTKTLTHKPTIPHMGWNQITPHKDLDLFIDIDTEQGFYFLHSYYFQCKNEANILATAEYAGNFCCAIRHENIYGFQFHPEKSLLNGVTLLKKFSEL